MQKASIVLLCAVLLTGLGLAVYTVRADALKAEALRMDAQQRRNLALQQDTDRLRAFVESPLCAKTTKP